MTYNEWKQKCERDGYISRNKTAELLGMANAQNVEELCYKNGIETCIKPITSGDGTKEKHTYFYKESVLELVEKRKQIAIPLVKSANKQDINKIVDDLAKEITEKVLAQLNNRGLSAASM